ncbi:MAG: hypothetical protein A2452_00005 [Candidatus Firestonebacteria bacterium RIFOXYC2_FULL_39_67]|nr:MAG: hypothetical protein A2536_01045 [Candidatus Firestonebacteria bacterium RIFOXYD2_FULL_39_29]OGF53368.1 MAG: hypothetical protein A2452_00005 [Candidatus Firestonebacteria bacterium RIFOXYC2_FULL_39_67]
MKEKSEVRQVGEREIWVGESRFYLDEDNILYITSVGEFDDETAIANKKAFLKLLNMAKGNLKQLIDLNKSGKSSVQARKIWKELTENERIEKLALFGLHPVARILASFGIGLTNKKGVRFFKTKEEALAWLKE